MCYKLRSLTLLKCYSYTPSLYTANTPSLTLNAIATQPNAIATRPNL